MRVIVVWKTVWSVLEPVLVQSDALFLVLVEVVVEELVLVTVVIGH